MNKIITQEMKRVRRRNTRENDYRPVKPNPLHYIANNYGGTSTMGSTT